MKQFFWFCVCCIILLAFGPIMGCSFLGDDGRMQAWKDAHVSDNTVLVERLKLREAKISAGQSGQATHAPTLTVTAYGPDGKTPISTTTVDLAPTISAVTGHSPDGDDSISGNTYVPMPKGAVAEGLDSTARVLQTPTAIITGTGIAIGSAIREAQPGVHVSNSGEGSVTLKDVNQQTSTVALTTGSGSATSTTTLTKSKTSNKDSGNTEAASTEDTPEAVPSTKPTL